MMVKIMKTLLGRDLFGNKYVYIIQKQDGLKFQSPREHVTDDIKSTKGRGFFSICSQCGAGGVS